MIITSLIVTGIVCVIFVFYTLQERPTSKGTETLGVTTGAKILSRLYGDSAINIAIVL